MMRNQHHTAAAFRICSCRLPDGRAIHLRAPALPPRSSCALPAAAAAPASAVLLRRGLGTDLVEAPFRRPATSRFRFLPSPHAPPAGSSFRRFISTARRRRPSSISTSGAMKIAVEGCMHGELDIVYDTLRRLEEAEGVKIDLLLCCGDFQAVRNENDLQCVNVPQKYRTMNSFWKYYSGEAVAPYPTIFIGGNHEASNYLWELYYGGWAAPNIYFLGFAGVVKFGNIRIGGLSGIDNKRHYHLGHYERPPYNEDTIRSVYHVRHYDVLKLMHLKEPLDVFLSHDWPLGITEYGNWQKLIRMKKHFEEEVMNRTLGSKPAAELLNKLKPPYWFSAHLHCKFPAIIQHGKNGPTTKFLALDKCLPGRNFLQVIDIPSSPGPYEIQYDEEWLAITRKFNSVFPLARTRFTMRDEQLDTQEDRQWVRSKLNTRGAKPFDFVQTAPPFNPSNTISTHSRTVCYRNPQTESFLQLLELPYLLDSSKSEGFDRNESSSQPGNTFDDEDIELPNEDEDEDEDEDALENDG